MYKVEIWFRFGFFSIRSPLKMPFAGPETALAPTIVGRDDPNPRTMPNCLSCGSLGPFYDISITYT